MRTTIFHYTTMRDFRIAIAPILMFVLAASSSCSDGDGDTSDDFDVAAAPVETFDMEQLMVAMQKSLDEENMILLKAIDHWDLITDEDRTAYWQLLQDRVGISDKIQRMFEVHPNWKESLCQWVDAKINTSVRQRMDLERQLRKLDDPETGDSRTLVFLLSIQPYEEAIMTHFRYQVKHPAAPLRMLANCVEAGEIEGENWKPDFGDEWYE